MFAETFRPHPRHVAVPSLPDKVPPGMWLLPSRAREQRAIDTMRACADVGQSTPGLLIEDGCNYYIPRMPTNWSRLHLDDHHELCGALHAAWKANPGLEWYGIISDGVRPVTRDWDRLLIAACAGKNFVSCNDNWRRDSRMAGILVFPGWIVEAMGYLSPPGMVHLYSDDILEQIGAALDNWVYVEGVVVKDWHWTNPSAKAAPDECSRRSYKGVNLHENDRNVFRQWRYSPEFDAAVQRIKSAYVARTGLEWGPQAAVDG